MRSSMLASRAAGIALLLIGIGLLALALLADTLDLGGGEGFGYQQLIAFIAGMVAILLSGAILLQPRFSQNGSSDANRHSQSDDIDR